MVCLLAASALFSGSETALFSLPFERRRELRRQTGRAARAVIRLLENPSSLLVTILFGNMTVNVLYFSVSTVVGIELHRSGPAVVAVFAGASLAALIIFGEVLPKVLAVNLSLPFSLFCALPLLVLSFLLRPVQAALVRVVRFFMGVLRIHKLGETRITEDELKMLVRLSEEQGVITPSERELIAEVVEFAQIRVAEVMTPRVDVPAFDVNDPIESLRSLLRETKWPRVPVYENNIDNILGIVLAKDVLLSDAADVRPFIRPVIYVPSLALVESALRLFRARRVHYAIAVDEYGGFDGFISVEDILGQIVGEIEREYEEAAPLVEQVGPTEYRLAGDLSIREWNELFGLEVAFPGFDTVGGLVLLLLGHIPSEGESVDFGQLTFTVERMRKRKIETIILRRRNGRSG